MDLQKFGRFLIIVGMIASLGGFLVEQIIVSETLPYDDEVRSARPNARQSKRLMQRTRERWEHASIAERVFWGGGVVFLVGVGVLVWARKPHGKTRRSEDKPTPR
ncbi:MAG: hypothetical protein ACXV3D_08880 [Halobacteriota archaeon]